LRIILQPKHNSMANHVKGQVNWKQVFSLPSLGFTVLGVVCAVIALKGFMIPNHFIDGGVTGIAILIEETFDINIALLLIILNLPFIFLGYKKVGKTFGIQSLFSVILLAVMMTLIDVPTVTEDKILIAIFGGFLIGLGIGLVIKGGGVIDGLEVIADYTNKKSGFTTSEIILLVNSLLFLGIANVFGIESAMYSILTYFTALKTSDYVVDGFEEFTALTIVSKNPEIVKSLIVNDYGKAISVYKGERGYLPETFHIREECDIVMTIVTRLEVHRLKMAIMEQVPDAFIYVQSIKEVKGGIIKQTKAEH
jgi:uncharacterized membrane-anchored protein YitT (DUF2179 family)